MNRRYAVILAAIAGVLLAYAAVNIRQTPWTGPAVRAVEQRGPLSDVEKGNIEIFEKVSPSVVQVVAVQSTTNPISEENEGVASGTGFIWDADGHVSWKAGSASAASASPRSACLRAGCGPSPSICPAASRRARPRTSAQPRRSSRPPGKP